nr:GTPase HflX [Anaerolineae bacterium]
MTENQMSGRPRAFLVGLEMRGYNPALDIEDSLEELGLLADTAGLQVVGQAYQRKSHPDPATYIGKGKVEEVEHWVNELGVDLVIFDDELSPRHQRELEGVFGEDVRVLDRTELILDIFAQHAFTHEGTLQVQLAQYEYRLPRLTRMWTHLARQAGGGAARGGAGGVGLRGPGETQLETDRREITRQIAALKQRIEAVREHRERHRAQRRQTGIPIVALVGYTNAGKSTLLNLLSGSKAYVADQLFATLDPTIRRVEMPNGQEILVSDTVGFIQKLPHTLVAAFHATLEEILEASLILHICDASHPNVIEHIHVVDKILREDIGITEIPAILVLNKMDAVGRDEQTTYEKLLADFDDPLPISAKTGYNIEALYGRMNEALLKYKRLLTVEIPYTKGDIIAQLYSDFIVLHEDHLESGIRLTGQIDLDKAYRYADYIAEDSDDLENRA